MPTRWNADIVMQRETGQRRRQQDACTRQYRYEWGFERKNSVQSRSRLAAVFLAGFFGLWSLPAEAQIDNYKVQITPYGFLTGVNGTVEEQGRSASVDASFRDILDHLI